MIINPRGSGGSGKTELVRRTLADYGWDGSVEVVPLRREGRERPIGYRLRHPQGGRPLVVLGHYARTSGGCDTLPAASKWRVEQCTACPQALPQERAVNLSLVTPVPAAMLAATPAASPVAKQVAVIRAEPFAPGQ